MDNSVNELKLLHSLSKQTPEVVNDEALFEFFRNEDGGFRVILIMDTNDRKTLSNKAVNTPYDRGYFVINKLEDRIIFRGEFIAAKTTLSSGAFDSYTEFGVKVENLCFIDKRMSV